MEKQTPLGRQCKTFGVTIAARSLLLSRLASRRCSSVQVCYLLRRRFTVSNVPRTTHVPVGADQAQHLEFARNCASSFNSAYGKVFIEPETVLSPAKRIMSLTRPGKKMSKSSRDPKSRIMITDSRETVFQKIRGAASDEESGITYDPQARPAISNLIDILYHLDEAAAGSLEALVDDCKDLSKRAFKERVAAAIEQKLAPIRAKFEEIIHQDEGRLLSEVAERGAARAAFRARGTMRLVKSAIGL
jgi:tryptophanyl-tRNA synthetase